MPKNYRTNCWRCSIRVIAVAVWRCERWLSLFEKSATDGTTAGGYEAISLRIRMAAVTIHTDPHVTNRQSHKSKYCSCWHTHGEWAVSHELVTLIAAAVAATDESGLRNCRTRVSLWQSAAERAGAVDGVLHVGGTARLRDAFVLAEGTYNF